ncbi:MAG: ABC transporter substrate-binding protein [Oscillospiraceae bacterium]|nr:ABC transporter substrate-binding protein [Oscillospiraceae bacterium]
MRNRCKRLLCLVLAAAMVLGLAGCGRQKDTGDEIPESTGGKDVVRAAAADRVFTINSNQRYSLNPLIATNHSNQLICDLVFENMVELDENFEVIPNLITEWRYTDDVGKTWEFTVAEGHEFHDGTPVTARDLSYTLNVCINADRFKGRFASFQGASYDNEKLYVTLGIGDTQFVKLLNLPVIKFNSYGNKMANNKEIPIGSGPYDLLLDYDEETDTSVYRLEAYAGYPWEGTPPVDTIYIKTLPTAEETISAFEDGIIDVVVNDPSSYTSLGYASSNEIHTFATTNMHFLYFNEDSPLARYSQFRIALQYAFDRNYLVELLDGNAVASAVPMYPTCAAYPDTLNHNLSYNMDTCRRILESAGVRDYDEDGKLEYMSGTPQEILFTVVVCADSSAKAGIVRRFQESMATIGFPVDVRELTWAEYQEALETGVVKNGNTDVLVDMFYGEVKLRNNFDITELLQPRTEDNAATNLNYTNSTDATVVDRINRYLGASEAARAGAYYELCEYITGVVGTLITIGFEKQQIITRRGVCKGVEPNFGNPLYNFANWTVDLG